MWGCAWLTDNRLASQEGLCYMEYVREYISALVGFLHKVVTSVHGYELDTVVYHIVHLRQQYQNSKSVIF